MRFCSKLSAIEIFYICYDNYNVVKILSKNEEYLILLNMASTFVAKNEKNE